MPAFILNDTEIITTLPAGTLLLDFIRYQQHLTGTKIGCREGDCGACTILVGEIKNDTLIYTSATSCLMPIGNATAKHIVTIEGLNINGLNAVQQAFSDNGATQCGFCTPGFIVSLAGFCINDKTPAYPQAIESMNGNICRCTGYKSIERAAVRITELMQKRNGSPSLPFAAENNIIPPYFLHIKERLQKIIVEKNTTARELTGKKMLAGGTDLYVQQHATMVQEEIHFLLDKEPLKGIIQKENICEIGASVTVSDLAASPIFAKHFLEFGNYIKLISSSQIRNMATIAGNFCNASPIGDFTIFFLALDAQLLLSNGINERKIPLRQLYKGYKILYKAHDEYIEKISFQLPASNSFFNFEKVSKRTHLDIASVNTAIYLTMEDGTITEAGLSAGGVGPIPAYLTSSSQFLKGKKISEQTITDLLPVIQSEISPISDVRGSAEYKRLLLQQLVKAHFMPLIRRGGE